MSPWTPDFCGTTVCYPASLGPSFALPRALAGIRGAGLDSVELVSVPEYCEHLMPESMSDSEAMALRDDIVAAGLTPVIVNLAADLTSDAGIRRLTEGLRVAGALGARTLVTHVEHIETLEHEQAFVARIDEIAAAAERYDVRIGLETHGGPCSTGKEAVAFVKRLGSPYLGITYDTANVIYYAGVSPEEDLAGIADDIGEHVFHFHLKDKATFRMQEYDFPAFGQGIVDLGELLSTIERAGYEGTITLEVELDGYPATPELVDEALATSTRHLKELLS
jgi:L-ribulose-5-phosphate 3-epimerase